MRGSQLHLPHILLQSKQNFWHAMRNGLEDKSQQNAAHKPVLDRSSRADPGYKMSSSSPPKGLPAEAL